MYAYYQGRVAEARADEEVLLAHARHGGGATY